MGRKRPMIALPNGGNVLLDRALLSLWQAAESCEPDQVVERWSAVPAQPSETRAALACLAEAGLLKREREPDKMIEDNKVQGALVSVILVNRNSRVWLEQCLPSLVSQTYSPLEWVIVDNASTDGSTEWVKEHYPHAALIRLEQARSLAYCLNLGLRSARGEYLLLLNPDVRLEINAIAQMVAVARGAPDCAAVAAKLRLSWAPAFLNGLGNSVGAISWGSDNGLGHLDLGQFDDWQEVPSACFAAALIPGSAWKKIGPIDEQFPLYYEDSEWCYRARLWGYTIRAAPQAVVYHALGSRIPSGETGGLEPSKLRQVVTGRLRFITKLLGKARWAKSFCLYVLEDSLNFILAILRGRWSCLRAYWEGWGDYLRSLPELLQQRKTIQAGRQRSDSELFKMQREIPPPLVWHGLPLLTWDLVCYLYLPLMLSGRSRRPPEFEGLDLGAEMMKPKRSLIKRGLQIWGLEGASACMHRIGRNIQWRLRQL